MNDKLINELRDCAEELTKIANTEVESEKTASVSNIKVATERSEYMKSIMVALGLEE